MNDETRADLQVETLRAVLRADLAAFTERCFETLHPALHFEPNWHHQALAYALERCMRGEIKRLVITLPPRSLKSVFTSAAFPAYVFGHDPSRKIVCASYNAELAGVLARDTRDIMEQDWYKKLFPQTRLSRRRSAESDFWTTRRGVRFATSVGGTLTGRGGSLIIIDDPMKADDVHSDSAREKVIAWFRETLLSRLDDKRNDVIILVMQRLHIDDLAGFVLATGEWEHLNLPAIAQTDADIPIGPGLTHAFRKNDVLHPEREDRELLRKLEIELGSKTFRAHYLQDPLAPDGTIIHLSWFKRFDEPPGRELKDEIIQSWDTAVKTTISNDYSVCTTWLVREKTYYLLDVFRRRLEFPELRRKVIDHAAEWRANAVLIEDASSGASLLQELRTKPPGATWTSVPIKIERDKVQRAEAQGVPIEAGRVLLPRAAPWLDAFQAEIRNFPRGHDDQVDSMTQFLAWVTSRQVWAKSINVKWWS